MGPGNVMYQCAPVCCSACSPSERCLCIALSAALHDGRLACSRSTRIMCCVQKISTGRKPRLRWVAAWMSSVQQASNTPQTAPPHIVWSSAASDLQQLRRKAEERNPDEFYFGMEKARTADGVHVQRSTEANKYSQDELRLMKTQDVNYLTLKAQAESKVCRLQAKMLRMQRCTLVLASAAHSQQAPILFFAESGAHAAIAAPHWCTNI